PKNWGKPLRPRPVKALHVLPRPLESVSLSVRERETGEHMSVTKGRLRAVHVRAVFDQSAGNGDRGATLTAPAASTCRLPLGRWIVCALILFPSASRADTVCVAPAMSTHATVGITRNFDEDERN